MQIVDGRYILPTDKLALDEGCYWDGKEPNKIFQFAEKFCRLHTDDFAGDGGRILKPIAWQSAWINTLYGWKQRNGLDRYNRSHVYIPKQQGKSVICSLLALYHLMRDKGSIVFLMASDIKQAKNIYERIAKFVQLCPSLGGNAKDPEQRGKKSDPIWLRPAEEMIEYRKNGGYIKIFSSVKSGKSGWPATCTIIDEFCELPEHSARLIYDRIIDGGMSRINSKFITISTPQYNWSHIGRENWIKGKDILDGKSDITSILPVHYGVDDSCDWTDPNNWWDQLPSADITVPKTYWLDRYKVVKGNPLEEIQFKTFLLGMWCGSPQSFVPPNVWQSLITTKTEQQLYGKRAVIGVDASRGGDLNVYCLVVEDEGQYYVLPRFFIPQEIAQKKTDKDNVPYTHWAINPNNNLHLTPGNASDYSYMRQKINDDAKNFRIEEIRVDPTYLSETVQIWQQQGYRVVEVSQSPKSMSSAFVYFESLTKQQKIKHPNNHILNWNLENCRPSYNKQEQLQVNKASDIQRCDGVDAICFALTYWLDKTRQVPIGPPPGQNWVGVW